MRCSTMSFKNLMPLNKWFLLWIKILLSIASWQRLDLSKSEQEYSKGFFYSKKMLTKGLLKTKLISIKFIF